MHFNNILMPFDGSDTSKKAAEYAIHIASLEKATLTFLHVLANIKQGGVIGLRARYGDMDLVEGFKRARKLDAEEWIKPIQKEADDNGIKTIVRILDDEGSSHLQLIIDYIKENNVDLVVLGSRGLSKFKQLLLGSTATGLSSHSTCPVLIIR